KIFAQDAKTGEVETFPDILRGWGITLDRTAGKPPLEWFNAVGKRVDEWLMYLTQRGVAEWDTTLSYPKTAIVQFNSVVYVSIKENKGEQPDKSQAAWSTLGVYLGLGNYYTKSESDTKIADAKKAGTDANNNANGRVPSTRKVNNKPLTEDINLAAGDVGAYTKAETDTKVADAKKAGTDAQNTANNANTAATNANNNANSRVPSTRKVNNKALSADISLNAGDVGAYTRAEVDSRISIASNGAVMNIRRGAAVNPPKQNEYGPKESPAGCVVTSVRHDPTTSYGLFFTYRPLQIYVNGSWKTLAGDA
ncbi:histidine kinase, partial [Providencia rettgeri]